MSKFEESKKDGYHKMLEDLCGTWKGISRTWFKKDVLADESSIEGRIYPALNGLFVIHEYNSSLQGKPMGGLMILGASFPEGKFQSAWIDSFHNGTSIMFSQEQMSGKQFNVLGSYPGASPEDRWGWRTTITQPDSDTLILTMDNIPPGSNGEKAVEFSYKREK